MSLYTQGNETLVRFPHLRAEVEEVQRSGSFCVEDLRWIAPCLGIAVRCSIEEGTYQQFCTTNGSDLEKDNIFGQGNVAAHLLASWQSTNGDENRLVGHFDLLHPTTRMLAKFHLPPDASWFKLFKCYLRPWELHKLRMSCYMILFNVFKFYFGRSFETCIQLYMYINGPCVDRI